MDTSERLAAYAAGELEPGERTALEAELAGDPALRAELAAIREVDRRLAALAPVAPPADFSARLRADLRTELSEHGAVVSLDAARARRERWMKPLAGVAAAAAVVGVVGVGLTNLGSSDSDEASSFDTSAMDGADDSMAAEEAFGGTAGDAQALAPSSAMPIYAEGGTYDEDSIVTLGRDRGVLDALLAASGDPVAIQQRNLALLAAGRLSGASTTAAAPDTATADEDSGSTDAVPAPEQLREGEATRDLVATCVPTILEDDRVPLFVDVGSFEGQSALIVVLGARAADGEFDRLEFWALSADDCMVLFFAQQG